MYHMLKTEQIITAKGCGCRVFNFDYVTWRGCSENKYQISDTLASVTLSNIL